ncbi:MAG: alcohol dehydrogenase [Phycisphaeraceae bacterium]|nr:alcohol dehydrogenase [Phycisphaeraceae bacterium]
MFAPRQVRLIEVPDATLDAGPADTGRILFQPELACLCGSDTPYFEGGYPDFQPRVGQSLHEMIGVVVASDGSRFDAGTRVLTVPDDQAGLFERFSVSDDRAIPLDARIPEEQGLLAQPLGTVIYALKKLPGLIDQDVVVVGQGPIGQLFCACVSNLGARQVIAIDPIASRLEVSPRMGATSTLAATGDDAIAEVRRLTDGAMADVVIEAVGRREQALNLCVELCRREGRLLAFGRPEATVEGVRWDRIYRKNLNLQMSVDPDFTRDYPLAMRWIVEGRIDVSPIVTHRFGLDDLQTAFETFTDRTDGALKVFIDFRCRN